MRTFATAAPLGGRLVVLVLLDGGRVHVVVVVDGSLGERLLDGGLGAVVVLLVLEDCVCVLANV